MRWNHADRKLHVLTHLQSAVERELVLRLASVLWRLRRATTMETGLFEIQADHLRELRQVREGGTDSPDIVRYPTGVLRSVLTIVRTRTASPMESRREGYPKNRNAVYVETSRQRRQHRTRRAAQAAADGYTLMVIDQISYVMNPHLYKGPYDPDKDFDPIGLPVVTTQVLMVHPSITVQTVENLVALIKADPGKYSWASGPAGSLSHLVSELFHFSLDLDVVGVPFNAAGCDRVDH